MPSTNQKPAWISVLNTLIGEAALVFLLSILAYILHDRLMMTWVFISPLPLQVLGISISVFLAFLNNTAYDRWWEGRTLWGGLVNQSRTFARQSLTLIHADPDSSEQDRGEVHDLQRKIMKRQIAYAHALKDSLRTNPLASQVTNCMSKEEADWLSNQVNIPAAILLRQGMAIAEARDRGWLHELALMNMDNTLTDMTNVQGGCERIKSTPIPSPYRVFSHNIAFAFCCALPFGLINVLHMKTPVIATAMALGFLTLERVGNLVSEPFASNPNGLQLDRMVGTIEADLTQRLNELESQGASL